MAVATEKEREAVKRRLRDDYPFYIEQALRIVTKTGDLVPFKLKQPQARLALQLMKQRDAGEPQRAVLLKARQVGMSTLAQALMICRTTQRPNHVARVVAHRRDAAASLFGMGEMMWTMLPEAIKPTVSYRNNSIDRKNLGFGEPSSMLRRSGVIGLNSNIQTDTASQAEAGRGLTIHSLHGSEVAFWDYAAKLDSLLNAVPETAESLVLLESTANGHNFFKDLWDAAEAGRSGYLPFFTPWFEEEEYRRPFSSPDERAEFEDLIGTDAVGEDEPELMRIIAASVREWEEEFRWTPWDRGDLSDEDLRTRVLEHLNWRRRRIASSGGDIEKFHQEYPSTPDEAFIATGRKVFMAEHVRRVLKLCEVTDPLVPTKELPGPERGAIVALKTRQVRSRRGFAIDVPQEAGWRLKGDVKQDELRFAHWRIWERPVHTSIDPETMKARDAGSYVVSVDPASGDENEGETAAHAITVIDHRSLKQVAELEVKHLDADEIAEQTLLAAMYYNTAWVVVERTGGWGIPILQRLRQDYRYARLYTERSKDRRTEHMSDRMGWSTDTASKPMLLARGRQLLREEVDGIRSRRLALQLLYYVADERGKTGPEPGKLADILMSWLIAQEVAARLPIKPAKQKGGMVSTGKRREIVGRTGWD